MGAVDYLLLGVLGLLIGDLLTMVIDRVPDGLPVFQPGPRCAHCEHPLGVGEIVPVVSWVVARGRCRHCSHRITPAYPMVELVTAGLFMAAGWRFGLTTAVIPFLILFSGLVALSTVDLYRYRLPDRILFPTLGLSFVAIVGVSLDLGVPGQIVKALIGSAIYFLMLFIPHVISPRGMGFGDVKLALLMGLFLGWLYEDVIYGFRLILYALLLGAVIGVAGGFLLAVTRRVTGRNVMPDPDPEPAAGGPDPARTADGAVVTVTPVRTVPMMAHSFPFGPALAAGCVIVLLYAPDLIG